MNFKIFFGTSIVLVLSTATVTHQQLVCHTGKRTSQQSGAVSADFYQGTICGAGQTCQNTVFHHSGNTGLTQTGGCYTVMGTDPTCAQLQATYNVSNVFNCTWNQCNTFACNPPTPPSGCPTTPANDIQVLPMCNVRQTYNKALACADALLSGYPYQGTQQCLANIDSAMACGITEMTTCLSGYCPTILDSLPVSLRPVYQEVLRLSVNYTSLNALFDLVQLTNTTVRNDIIKTACLQSDSPYLQNVTQLLATLNLNLTIENPVCDNQVVQDLFDAGVAEVGNILNAQTHAELCAPINKLQAMAVNMWQTRCNKTAVIELLRPLIPSYYAPLFPQIELGLDIAEELMINFAFPGCQVSASTASPVDTTSGVAGLKQHYLQQSLYIAAMAALTAAAL